MDKSAKSPRNHPCLKVCTDGMLDSTENDNFSKAVKDCQDTSFKRYRDIDQRLTTVNENFSALQGLASRVTREYEKQAIKIGGSMNRKELLQGILDNNLNIEDVRLFCRLIDRVFDYIISQIQRHPECTVEIKSIRDVHTARRENEVIGKLYDDIAGELLLNNSGKSDSDIFHLHSFRHDFSHTLIENTQQTCDSSSSVSVSQDESSVVQRERLENIPIHLPEVIDEMREKIKSGVHDLQLAKALNTCTNIIRKIGHESYNTVAENK